MKNRIYIILSTLALSLNTLSADIDSGDYGSEQMAQVDGKGSPFKIDFRGDWIKPVKTKNGYLKGDLLHYDEFQADVSGVFYYNECHKEAIGAQLSFNSTSLYWNDNPYYDQKRFNNFGIVIGGVTNRLCGWTWQGSLAANMDTKHLNFGDYTTYDILLWGRHDWRKNIGVHVGFIAWSGLKIDKILPVLGFDWTFCEKWRLNAIFPINVSLVYSFNECLSVSAAGRFFWNRHRIEEDALLSRGIWEYKNGGAEIAVNYALGKWLTVNLHGGYTLGGNVKLSNMNHKHTQKYEFGGSPYAGGEIAVKF